MGPREGWTPAALSSAATSRKSSPQEWPHLSCQLGVWVWLNEVTETVAGPQNPEEMPPWPVLNLSSKQRVGADACPLWSS